MKVMDSVWFELTLVTIACLTPVVGSLIFSFGVYIKMPSWFRFVNKPKSMPPNRLFAPVWTTLYVLMGYASYRVFRTGSGFYGDERNPLMLYILQLLLCWMWPRVFFSFHHIGIATIHICILNFTVILTGIAFYFVDLYAGLIFVPYATWMTYMMVLCLQIWNANRVTNRVANRGRDVPR